VVEPIPEERFAELAFDSSSFMNINSIAHDAKLTEFALHISPELVPMTLALTLLFAINLRRMLYRVS